LTAEEVGELVTEVEAEKQAEAEKPAASSS